MRIWRWRKQFLLLIIGLTVTANAHARRPQRSGFNFGTSIRLVDVGHKTTPGIGSDQNTQMTSDSQAITPYVGYAFDSLNFGLAFVAENGREEVVERSENGFSTTTRQSSRRTTGGNVFLRFLFGEVFFFEAAGGIYQEQLNIAHERKEQQGDGDFSGESDAYEVRGLGPGYHFGAGLELPMGGNFFFTSAYQFRMVTLRDYGDGMSLGKRRSMSEKREALFGVAYYHR